MWLWVTWILKHGPTPRESEMLVYVWVILEVLDLMTMWPIAMGFSLQHFSRMSVFTWMWSIRHLHIDHPPWEITDFPHLWCFMIEVYQQLAHPITHHYVLWLQGISPHPCITSPLSCFVTRVLALSTRVPALACSALACSALTPMHFSGCAS